MSLLMHQKEAAADNPQKALLAISDHGEVKNVRLRFKKETGEQVFFLPETKVIKKLISLLIWEGENTKNRWFQKSFVYFTCRFRWNL